MKKITIAVGLMLGALSFTGCQYDVLAPAKTDKGVKVQKLTITTQGAMAASDETRTVIEGDKTTGFSTSWHADLSDNLGVYAHHVDATPAELTMNAEFSITSIVDGIATFEGDIQYAAEDMTYDIYAYSPRDLWNTSANSSHNSVDVVVAPEQYMSANNTHDHKNDLMVALPGQQVTVSGGEVLTTALDNFQFRYMVGFMNLSVKEIAAAGIEAGVAATDVVKSVSIVATSQADVPVVTGGFKLDLAESTMVPYGTSNEVTAYLPEGVTLADMSAWAVVAPFAADELTFTITTESHIISKTATIEQLRGGFAIAAGGIKTFNMTIDENCTITPIIVQNVQLVYGDMAEYWGDYYGQGTHDMLLYFLDFDPTGEDFNGIELDLEVVAGYMDMSSELEFLDLPNATYPIVGAGVGANTVTTDPSYSYILTVVDGNVGEQYTITGGSMTVEGDHTNYNITFDITHSGGRLIAEYNGPLNIPNPDYLPPAGEPVDFGTLTKVNGMRYLVNAFGNGSVDGWLLDFWDESLYVEDGYIVGTGWFVRSQIHTPINSGQPMPDAEYIIAASNSVGTALAGYINPGTGAPAGTWAIYLEDGATVEQLALTSGTITSNYSSGEYTIDVDGLTANGTIVTGTLQGAPPVVTATATIAPKANAWKYRPNNFVNATTSFAGAGDIKVKTARK